MNNYTFENDITSERAQACYLYINNDDNKPFTKKSSTGYDWPKYIEFAKTCLQDIDYNLEVAKILNADGFVNPQPRIGSAIQATLRPFLDPEVLNRFSKYNGLRLYSKMKEEFNTADGLNKIGLRKKFLDNFKQWSLRKLSEEGMTIIHYVPDLKATLNSCMIEKIPTNEQYEFLKDKFYHNPGKCDYNLENAEPKTLYNKIVKLLEDKRIDINRQVEEVNLINRGSLQRRPGSNKQGLLNVTPPASIRPKL